MDYKILGKVFPGAPFQVPHLLVEPRDIATDLLLLAGHHARLCRITQSTRLQARVGCCLRAADAVDNFFFQQGFESHGRAASLTLFS